MLSAPNELLGAQIVDAIDSVVYVAADRGYANRTEFEDLLMPKPFVISLPHQLGKEEARRRLEVGLKKATAQFGSVITVDEEIWSGDRLTFRIVAMKQLVSGTLDVYDDRVQLEVLLPWLLAGLAHGAQAIIKERGQRLLEKK